MIKSDFYSNDYKQVLKELNSRAAENHINPSLTRITKLLSLLNQPQFAYKSIHISGTNGKTSITRMIDAVLTVLGYRTGRIISPHLQSITERIAVANQPISLEEFVRAYKEILPYANWVDKESHQPLSYFEMLTAMAYNYFADLPIDVAVVETGMGGKWDATNVINSQVAVITNISIDHIDYLGSDLESITEEKLGITLAYPDYQIDNQIVVSAAQMNSVAAMIVNKAQQNHIELRQAEKDFRITERKLAVGGQLFSVTTSTNNYTDIFLPLFGIHQVNNAAVAIAAVEAFLGINSDRILDSDIIREAFFKISSPGRLEKVDSQPPVFIDAAHNPNGAKVLIEAITNDFNFKPLIGVVSILKDKDAVGILSELVKALDKIVITTNNSNRALSTTDLEQLALKVFTKQQVYTAPNVNEAIVLAKNLISSKKEYLNSAAILVIGSVVLAGEVRDLYKKL